MTCALDEQPFLLGPLHRLPFLFEAAAHQQLSLFPNACLPAEAIAQHERH
jgi:hypothetical protein